MKILLVGNPNVGKSALFSRFTGVDIVISNYAGTTVEFKKGHIWIGEEKAEVIDVPGIYSFSAASKAEEVATEMLRQGDIVINVVDATNLERNLYLTMQLLEKGIPVIMALNFWNETRHRGIQIDVKKLEEMLRIPVVPTVAITAQGVKKLVERIREAKPHLLEHDREGHWRRIEHIIGETHKARPKKHTLLQRIEDLTVHPWTGIPFAILVIAALFYSIRTIGEGLISYVFDPLFSHYLPLMQDLSSYLGQGILHDILIGQLIEGKIDLLQSMGLLTTAIYVPVAMVLPYVFAFYILLSLLEDSGYLPRLSTLIDSFMHRIGLHGLAIIPMMLGMGCNVPGVMSTRILESRKQRFIVITLLSIAIPCMAQTAMIFGLLGRYGILALGIVFITLAIVWICISLLLNRLIKEGIPETFIEITPYRIPKLNITAKKVYWRMKGFMKEAIPFMLLGVLIVNILYILDIITWLAGIAGPVVSRFLGLPGEAVSSLLIGFLRKDMAMGMLLPLGLTMKQMIIASVVLTMYFPCIATFVIIFKELGFRDTLKSTALMIASTLIVGGILNLLL